MVCFNRKKLTFNNLDKNVVLLALLEGIWPRSPFKAKLAWRTSAKIQDFRSKVEEYITAKETIRAFIELADRT